MEIRSSVGIVNGRIVERNLPTNMQVGEDLITMDTHYKIRSKTWRIYNRSFKEWDVNYILDIVEEY